MQVSHPMQAYVKLVSIFFCVHHDKIWPASEELRPQDLTTASRKDPVGDFHPQGQSSTIPGISPIN